MTKIKNKIKKLKKKKKSSKVVLGWVGILVCTIKKGFNTHSTQSSMNRLMARVHTHIQKN